MEQKHKMRDLLKDTVEYYSADPLRRAIEMSRSFSKPMFSCMYKDKKGHCCAIGRILKNSSFEHEFILKNLSIGEIKTREQVNLFKLLLKEEYQDLPIDFLEDLQNLHDSLVYWTKDGLSEDGKYYINHIKEEIENGNYT